MNIQAPLLLWQGQTYVYPFWIPTQHGPVWTYELLCHCARARLMPIPLESSPIMDPLAHNGPVWIFCGLSEPVFLNSPPNIDLYEPTSPSVIVAGPDQCLSLWNPHPTWTCMNLRANLSLCQGQTNPYPFGILTHHGPFGPQWSCLNILWTLRACISQFPTQHGPIWT